MTISEAREAITRAAITASNIISGFEDDDERYELEMVLRETFAKERELARQHRRAEARIIAVLNGNGT